MPTIKRNSKFIDSEEGKAIRDQLEEMMGSSLYSTTSTYSANTEIYSDNLISFADKHMNYLTAHPNLSPAMYLANLRLMTKSR